MKKTLLLLTSFIIIASCEKHTDFSVNQADINFSESGGKQHISLTANKPWTVKSDQSYPSLQDHNYRKDPICYYSLVQKYRKLLRLRN